MNAKLSLALSLGLVGSAALAQPNAVLHGDILEIAGGAVIDDAGVAYYRDIRLVAEADGRFRVAQAEAGKVASVEEVNVTVGAEAVEVSATGFKSTPCVDLLPPVVSRDGEDFVVVLAETEPTSELCILRLDPFESTFLIDTADLAPGAYSVVVNGVEADFTL